MQELIEASLIQYLSAEYEGQTLWTYSINGFPRTQGVYFHSLEWAQFYAYQEVKTGRAPHLDFLN